MGGAWEAWATSAGCQLWVILTASHHGIPTTNQPHQPPRRFDATRMPLGKLQKATILEGYDVLKQISNVIGCASANTSSSSGGSTGISGGSTGISGGSSGISGGSGGLGIVGAAGRAEIERLTNAFYTVIPHVSQSSRAVISHAPSPSMCYARCPPRVHAQCPQYPPISARC